MSRDPIEVAAEIERVRRAGEWIERALFAVAAGALVFTMLNVTLFAMQHGTPWWMAWLLDPLASVALLAALVGDGVLSRYGHPCGGWGTALKWVAACGTWSMNIWASVAAGSAAGVVLHSVAPALVVLLAEAAPRYRIRFATVVAELERKLPAGAVAGAAESGPVVPSGAARPGGASEPHTTIGTTGDTDSNRLTTEVASPGGGQLSPLADTQEPPRVERDGSAAGLANRTGARSGRPVAVGRRATRTRDKHTMARSLSELRAELAAAIEAGLLEPAPSAEAIRKTLRISPARARRLRDEHQRASQTRGNAAA